MRNKVALLVLAIALAGCGGSTPGPTGAGSIATPNPTTAGGGPTAGSGGNGGSVDCAALTTAAQQLLGIQLLAQMTTPETVESIKKNQIGALDPQKMLDALATLHALDGVPSQFGDVKSAIGVYEKAATAAKALFAKSNVTQADVDEFYKTVGSINDFLGHQIAISGAMSEAGC